MSYLTLNSNDTIYYEEISGPFDQPFLVFLHEGLGCLEMWKTFAEKLCWNCRCPGIIYDRTGYGKSSALSSPRTIKYLHDYAFKELPQVLESIIPDLPYILVGHSDGGSISLLHGSKQPQLLKGIITEAAHIFVEPVTTAGIKTATQAFADGKLNGLYKFHGDKTESTFYAWSDTWLSPEFLKWNIEDCLPKINTHLLVIQGIDDQYGTQKQVDGICSQVAGPAQPEMINNCGHAPHLDQKTVVISLMADFISKVAHF